MHYEVKDYDFNLPDELIARFPTPNREDSRLLYFKGDLLKSVEDRKFTDIVELIPANSVLVRNNTRVIPARCYGRKPSGAKIEILVERITGSHEFLAHVRANRSPKPGQILVIGEDKAGQAQISPQALAQVEQLAVKLNQAQELGNELAISQFKSQIQQLLAQTNTHVVMCTGRSHSLFCLQALNQETILNSLQEIGHMPLPPYMERQDQESDNERYQTVYAKIPGAVAAPTAGLHFTDALIEQLKAKGVEILEVTLHVGAGTFMPIKVDSLQEHQMHAEWIEISPEVAEKLNLAKIQGRKIVAVGTTSVRSLETMVQYSINKYLDQLGDPSLLAKREALIYRDLLDKVPQAKLNALILAANQLKLNLSHQEQLVLANLSDFLCTKQLFASLKLGEANKQHFLAQSWKLLLKLAEQADKFANAEQQTLEFIQTLASDQEQKDYSFTNHYLNTKLEMGSQIPLVPYTGNTEIFIHPGHRVHLVDYIVTNFHLPKSTLIMLVAGFIGFDYCLKAYHHAIAQKYRFYSYGDSCFMPNLRLNDDVEFL
nr:S-adenosylmethionine:tRNA ribosyltransferase-isomerase [Psittacicella melopsittaci]